MTEEEREYTEDREIPMPKRGKTVEFEDVFNDETFEEIDSEIQNLFDDLDSLDVEIEVDGDEIKAIVTGDGLESSSEDGEATVSVAEDIARDSDIESVEDEIYSTFFGVAIERVLPDTPRAGDELKVHYQAFNSGRNNDFTEEEIELLANSELVDSNTVSLKGGMSADSRVDRNSTTALKVDTNEEDDGEMVLVVQTDDDEDVREVTLLEPIFIIDNFEEEMYEDEGKGLSDYYDGDVDEFERTTARTPPDSEGDYSLYTDDQLEDMGSTEGLPEYPERGDNFEFWVYSGDGDESRLAFFSQGSEDPWSGSYFIDIGTSDSSTSSSNYFEISRYVSSSTAIASDGSTPIPYKEWLRVEVQTFEDNDEIVAILHDSEGNKITEISATDDAWDEGGIVWGVSSKDEYIQYWADLQILGGD